MTDLVIRSLAVDEADDVFHSMDDPGLVGRAILPPPNHRYRTAARGGDERAEWTWVAQRDGKVVARAAYWGGPGDQRPTLLAWFDFTDQDAGVELLRATPHTAAYELELPAGWRDDEPTRLAAQTRIDAAVRAGYEPLVERLAYRWTPECGVPEDPGRLEFRPEPDDDVIMDVLRRVHSVTLDAHAQLAIRQGGLEQAAREEMDFFDWCVSPREWRRLAYTPEGELVGIHVPVRNPSAAAVGFIGVLPEQRGHGFGYDLLVACTRDLVLREGAEVVAGATDCGNTGMAKAFATAGYPVSRHRYTLTHPG